MMLRISPRWWTTLGFVLVVLLVAGSWGLMKVISPSPPRSLNMGTGAADGAYRLFGLKYQAALKANGIVLNLKTSTGSIENLARLNADEVSVAFVQGGLGPTATIGNDGEDAAEALPLRSLGTVAFEPVWIFSHTLDLTNGLTALRGKSIAVGVAGSGNHKVALELLTAYGLVDAQGAPQANTQLVAQGGLAAVAKLQAHAVDAMVVVAAPQAASVKALLADPKLKLASLAQAEGLARRFPYLQTVSLKRGSVNPALNLPANDVTLLSTTASLVVREELHPALAYLLLETAHTIHSAPSLLAPPNTFPRAESVEFVLADEAQRYFKNGRPFLQTYLPFWAANFVQRLGLMAVPLLAILVPFFRVVLPGIAWWQKGRINKHYGALKFLEAEIAGGNLTAEHIAQAHAHLDHIERDVLDARFPLDFADRVYTLRQHVALVRDSLGKPPAA
jgi:TRAP transporter TAXI family solute receptor